MAASDKEGLATRFVEYMMGIIQESLSDLVSKGRVNLTGEERLQYFKDHADLSQFTRKDYMAVFKDISSATASRDLRMGVQEGFLLKEGENRNTTYEFILN